MKLQFSYEWLDVFQSLPASARNQVLSKLKDLERAQTWPHQALKGERFRGLFKFRVGDYRLIYQIQESGSLDFIYMGHRRDVYK